METILTILGTRPEAIKLAPVIHELERRPDEFRSVVCTTGQHRELLEPMLRFFHIQPDVDLDVMRENQQLGALTARLVEALDPVFERIQPDWVIVQGDTTTVLATALAAYYRRIRVAHVEAGLRTGHRDSPFPEEVNRRVAGVIADLHFAPTERAMRNLRRESTPADRICLSGNTVVDALQWSVGEIAKQPPEWPSDVPALADMNRLLLVTGHRRENFGQGLQQVCVALREIAETLPDCDIIYPVHLNPNVREPVHRLLGEHPRIHLAEPVDYPIMVALLKRSWLVLTDSGGIQEEAPTFHVPCLVTREKTERPEGVRAGVAKLVGTDANRIVRAVTRLHNHPSAYEAMTTGENPYGDGRAAERIVSRLAEEESAHPRDKAVRQ